jgi:Zn-dependent peptidase ImmA (M78 family)
MTTLALEKKAADVLRKTGVTGAPVPIHLVAQRLGLLVEGVALGNEVSGVLVIDGDRGIVGYNLAHSATRQRFTIAHEIGHYQLHREDASLFIDERYFAAFRNSLSSSGSDRRERQANAFAAALLMPAHLVERELKNRNFDLGDEEGLRDLAGVFQVSVQAMVYRLTNLGILFPPADLGDSARPKIPKSKSKKLA